ncbi:MAG: phosphatidylglycerophosphatase A [Rhodospirillaceae bacterium]|nr:phosphatidylglycerophosphatase A [Rhodospirillaceae bacterium]|tara:strand:- start:87 stop:569 length:483 start_codon:yes stop_codon:yes gene_type:complete
MSSNQPSLPRWHPVTILLTWFYSGFSSVAPGTCGSLAAIPFAWIVLTLFGTYTFLIILCFLLVLGIWSSHWALQKLKEKDPKIIVLDEVIGQGLVLAVAPITPVSYLLAFILFRLFDIYKPWPIHLIDNKMKGALGVMLDDVIAGLYGAVTLLIILELMG